MELTRLGPYAIRGRIGRGGMGAVYEAVDETTGTAVAVKTLAAHIGDDPGIRRRFATEIETLKALRHPGIVRLLAFGEDDGQPYFAMELVKGRSLEQLLRDGRRFTWRETVATALEVTRALKTAHDHGVVHRDIKPANLLFADEPADGVTVKLADFGIARLFGDAGHTLLGTVVGTAEYMSPEQAAGKLADQRADLYSLGTVMFAMLAGRPPFRGGPALEVIERQLHEKPPRVATLAPDVPAELDELVARMLDKDPARRPASALALGRLLGAIDTMHAPGETIAAPESDASPTAPGVDLLADTLDVRTQPRPVASAGGATRRNVAADAATRPAPGGGTNEPGAQATTPDTVVGVAAAPRTRFTTVADLDRTSREQASRAARREWLWKTVIGGVMLATLAWGGWFLLQPESADDLHARIMAIAGDEEADLRDARPLIDRFLEMHASDPRVDAVRKLDRTLDLDAFERKIRRRMRLGRDPEGSLERDYRAAMAREAESPSACLESLEAFSEAHAAASRDPDGDLWLALVRRQIERLEPLAARERSEDLARGHAMLVKADQLRRQAERTQDPASRARLMAEQRKQLESLVDMYGSRPHMKQFVARAKTMLTTPPSE